MCCPPESNNGVFYKIRRIFTGRSGLCDSPCRGEAYPNNQLRCFEQDICSLEDEVNRLEGAIRYVSCCKRAADFNYLRCTLKPILEKLAGIRRDLECANGCYNPCRDQCELELIRVLLERVCCLDNLVNNLCQRVNYLEAQKCEVNSQTPLCRKTCCNTWNGPRQVCGPCGYNQCSQNIPSPMKWSSCNPGDSCALNPCEPRDCVSCQKSPCNRNDCYQCGPRAFNACAPPNCSTCEPHRISNAGGCYGINRFGPCGRFNCCPNEPNLSPDPCCKCSTCCPTSPRLACGADFDCLPCTDACANVCCVSQKVRRTDSVIPVGVMLVKL
ncbi:keratin-associated protein 4-12-like [Macrosteles quadrilineatus]|uniref:keratin-associated protein 4-12-like n=1 Tax=Macrosteles quadrilineatus TaxID=74068 RepID=UPI0023E24D8C|nr:keratin-associated protein 4-12-like [Macrosteles quadrilineatus]